MKLRLHNNSIRLRLNRQDVQRLLDVGSIQSQLISDFQQWTLRLTMGSSLEIDLHHEGFTFTIPEADAQSLRDDQVENLDYVSGDLKLMIQKEFACLHPQNNSLNDNHHEYFQRRNAE